MNPMEEKNNASKFPERLCGSIVKAQKKLEGMRDATLKALSELPDCDGSEGYQGDEADRASARSEVENLFQERESLQAKITEINRALRKITYGEYGICEATGDEIPSARLDANPLARYTVEYQSTLESKLRLGIHS